MDYFVAPSYQKLERIGEPFEINKKLYQKVRMKNGSAKQVRLYTKSEYEKFYPPITIVQPAKSRRDTLGFGEAGYIWIFRGNTYDVLDWFQMSPCRYTRVWGWYLPSNIEMPDPLPVGIEPIKLEWDEVSFDGQLIAENELQKLIDTKLYDEGTSKWLGEIGDRLTVDLTCTGIHHFMSDYGETTFYLFETDDGDVVTWNTQTTKNIQENEKYTCTFTIKAKTTYKNVKQTQVSRLTVRDSKISQ